MDRFNRTGATEGVGATSANAPASGHLQVIIPGGPGNAHTEVQPIVADTPLNPALAGATNSLADLEQSAYRLRRIVGKIFIGAQQAEGVGGSTANMLVTAGLIVLRVDSTGAPLNTITEDYSVNNLANIADPWIWRRSWVLTNIPQAVLSPGTPIAYEYNTAAGSVADGPHVDAKTARIVGPEERLFLAVTGMSIDGNPNDQLNNRVFVDYDLRVLASMRSSQGNRRNASR